MLAGILLVFAIVTSANATVLTFDDISTDSIGTIGDGYGGLDWDNMGFIKNTFNANSGYDNGTVSGDYTAFNQWAQVGTVNDTSFDFNGAYLTGAWNTGLNIKVTGSLNGADIYSQTVTVDTTGPTWFDFNFLGIDSLAFSSFGGVNAELGGGAGAHFAMDDFTFNQTVDPVPEPATILLMGVGLLGLIGYRRKNS